MPEPRFLLLAPLPFRLDFSCLHLCHFEPCSCCEQMLTEPGQRGQGPCSSGRQPGSSASELRRWPLKLLNHAQPGSCASGGSDAKLKLQGECLSSRALRSCLLWAADLLQPRARSLLLFFPGVYMPCGAAAFQLFRLFRVIWSPCKDVMI